MLVRSIVLILATTDGADRGEHERDHDGDLRLRPGVRQGHRHSAAEDAARGGDR